MTPISISPWRAPSASKFRNGGQTCVCANRILVQTGVYDVFADKLGARVKAMKVGPWNRGRHRHRSMINTAAIEKIDRHVKMPLAKGLRLRLAAARWWTVSNMQRRSSSPAQRPTCCWPPKDLRPCLPRCSFGAEEGAIAIANGTPFGLAAYFYTES